MNDHRNGQPHESPDCKCGHCWRWRVLRDAKPEDREKVERYLVVISSFLHRRSVRAHARAFGSLS